MSLSSPPLFSFIEGRLLLAPSCRERAFDESANQKLEMKNNNNNMDENLQREEREAAKKIKI